MFNHLNWISSQLPDLSNKVAIVTGANSGIGFITARELLRKNAKVYIASRSKKRTDEAIKKIKETLTNPNVLWLEYDACDLDSVKNAASTFINKESRLHILVNNAGVMAPPYSETKDGFEVQFQTNYLSHYLFTRLLLPVMKKTLKNEKEGAVRIINVSSRAHSMSLRNITYNDLNMKSFWYWPELILRWLRYAQSKLALILFTKSIFEKYSKDGIYAISVHPGVVRTGLFRYTNFLKYFLIFSRLFISEEEGAITQIFAAASNDIIEKKLNGEYLIPYCKKAIPFGDFSLEASEKLWEFSEKELKDKGYL
ncbi:hypothetical protein MERGE_003029 [Pneumocystis wakefieldiae]|uniref:NAD(P)-binding protein n=1 Tax=Pneumocystis wakefieldiae TaxID=38082 RepID=A0A899FZI1_9ASCO|nr:hypothetical protein MERGE_003029 [Pneumocystis wakefieldiae]